MALVDTVPPKTFMIAPPESPVSSGRFSGINPLAVFAALPQASGSPGLSVPGLSEACG